MPESRRVRMTKRLMRDALLDLLETKPLAKITVTDVCAAADINRSTFYAYYPDVTALLRATEEEAIAHIPEAPTDLTYYEPEELLDIFEEYFGYVKENARLFRILSDGAASDDFHLRLMERIVGNFHHRAPADAPLLTRYGYIYSINGSVGLLKSWIADGFPLSPRSFSKLVTSMSVQANDLRGIDLD